MKWFADGDKVCVTYDSFVNLQESPAIFVPADSEIGAAIIEIGIGALTRDDRGELRRQLLEAKRASSIKAEPAQ